MSKSSAFGTTTDFNGKKLSKNDPVIHLIGACDELNAQLGLVKAMLQNTETLHFIEAIQKNIMRLMSHTSDNKNEKYFFGAQETASLENETDKLTQKNPEVTGFVIPGKNVIEAQIHIARTAARRAERLFYVSSEKYKLCENAGEYLNKLSGYLFALSVSAACTSN